MECSEICAKFRVEEVIGVRGNFARVDEHRDAGIATVFPGRPACIRYEETGLSLILDKIVTRVPDAVAKAHMEQTSVITPIPRETGDPRRQAVSAAAPDATTELVRWETVDGYRPLDEFVQICTVCAKTGLPEGGERKRQPTFEE